MGLPFAMFQYISGIHFVGFVSTFRHLWIRGLNRVSRNIITTHPKQICRDSPKHHAPKTIKTFIIYYIHFSLNMCWIWNLGPFSRSSQVILKYIPPSLPGIRQSQSCGGWGKGHGGWAETFGVFFGAGFPFHRIRVWHIYLHLVDFYGTW